MWKFHFINWYTAIPKATATFKLSFRPHIGICTTLSQYFKILGLKPLTSLPTTRAIFLLRFNLNPTEVKPLEPRKIFFEFFVFSSPIILTSPTLRSEPRPFGVGVEF